MTVTRAAMATRSWMVRRTGCGCSGLENMSERLGNWRLCGKRRQDRLPERLKLTRQVWNVEGNPIYQTTIAGKGGFTNLVRRCYNREGINHLVSNKVRHLGPLFPCRHRG